MTAHVRVPRPGDLLALTEDQYRFGIGPVLVRVRVRAILAAVEYDGQPWWHVSGEVANGTAENHGGWIDRDVYVEAAALRQPHPPHSGPQPPGT